MDMHGTPLWLYSESTVSEAHFLCVQKLVQVYNLTGMLHMWWSQIKCWLCVHILCVCVEHLFRLSSRISNHWIVKTGSLSCSSRMLTNAVWKLMWTGAQELNNCYFFSTGDYHMLQLFIYRHMWCSDNNGLFREMSYDKGKCRRINKLCYECTITGKTLVIWNKH